MDAKTNGAALLAAAQGNRGELDALLETIDERDLAVAILHVANVQNASKRELFAAMAMQGILANRVYDPPRRTKLAGMAEDAVRAADALLAAITPESAP